MSLHKEGIRLVKQKHIIDADLVGQLCAGESRNGTRKIDYREYPGRRQMCRRVLVGGHKQADAGRKTGAGDLDEVV
jgi:hypothetical protein